MSILNTFFIAPENDLESLTVPPTTTQFVAAFDWSGFTNLEIEELCRAVGAEDCEFDVHGGEDGPWLTRLPERLTATLASIDQPNIQIREIAANWTQIVRSDGRDLGDVTPFLLRLTTLCKRAVQANQKLYFWFSL